MGAFKSQQKNIILHSFMFQSWKWLKNDIQPWYYLHYAFFIVFKVHFHTNFLLLFFKTIIFFLKNVLKNSFYCNLLMNWMSRKENMFNNFFCRNNCFTLFWIFVYSYFHKKIDFQKSSFKVIIFLQVNNKVNLGKKQILYDNYSFLIFFLLNILEFLKRNQTLWRECLILSLSEMKNPFKRQIKKVRNEIYFYL